MFKNFFSNHVFLRMMAIFALIFTIAIDAGNAHAASAQTDANSAQLVSASKGKRQCIRKPDGTKDCTNAFIEVGKPAKGRLYMATGCGGLGCDGKDPYAMGCNVDYGVIDMNYIMVYDEIARTSIRGGYVQLWWSNTCQTNWARVVITYFPGGQRGNYRPSETIARKNSDGSYTRYSYTGGYGWGEIWGDMVYAPTSPAQACAYLDSAGNYRPPASACTNWW